MPSIYLPQVFGDGITGQADTCGMPREAVDLFALLRAHPDQQRASVQCHPVLVAVAQGKAEDMGRRNYFGHTDPDGHGPNWHVRQAGYRLPDWYGKENSSNNIESISAGQSTAASAWQGWMQSESHRPHALGEGFYSDQVNVGVGYSFVGGSHFRHYWTLISCPADLLEEMQP